MTIIEDDTPGVSVSVTALTIPEGDAQSYTVVLDTEPTADVTVALQVPDTADVAVDETALTFTADKLGYTADGNGHRRSTTPTLSMMIR